MWIQSSSVNHHNCQLCCNIILCLTYQLWKWAKYWSKLSLSGPVWQSISTLQQGESQFNTCTWTYHMSALLWLNWWTYSKLQVVNSYRRLKNYPLFQGYRSFTNVLSSTNWQTGHVTGLIQQGILCVKCPTMAPGSLSWSAAIAYMSVMLIAALM